MIVIKKKSFETPGCQCQVPRPVSFNNPNYGTPDASRLGGLVYTLAALYAPIYGFIKYLFIIITPKTRPNTRFKPWLYQN